MILWPHFTGGPVRQLDPQVLPFVITVTYAPSAAASDAKSEAAGDAGTSSRPSDNAGARRAGGLLRILFTVE